MQILKQPFQVSCLPQISAEGRVLRYLADSHAVNLAYISAVVETPKGLFMGHVAGDYVSFLAREHWPPALGASDGRRRSEPPGSGLLSLLLPSIVIGVRACSAAIVGWGLWDVSLSLACWG